MTIRGTHFQDEHWPNIKKILLTAMVEPMGDPQQADSIIAGLLQAPDGFRPLIDYWLNEVQEVVGGKMLNTKDERWFEILSRASELILVMKAQPELPEKPLRKLVGDLRAQPEKPPPRSLCQRYLRTSLGRFLSELRYIADAANLTVLTGRTYTKTRLLRLAKVDELKRKLDALIAIKDEATLAEILDQEPNAFTVAAAKNREKLPRLILRTDIVLRSRQTYERDGPRHREGEPKAPELPTKKYGNTVTEDKVSNLLRDLDDIQLQSSYDDNIRPDWLLNLDDELHDEPEEDDDEAVTAHEEQPTSAISSPGIDQKESDEFRLQRLTQLVTRKCLERFAPVFRKGIFLSVQNELMDDLDDQEIQEWFYTDGQPNTLKSLWQESAMKSRYLFKQALNNVIEEYKQCLRRRLQHLDPQENEHEH